MATKLAKYNKYDIYIFLLVVSCAFGNYGGLFQVERIIGVALVPVMLSRFNLRDSIQRPFIHFLFFFAIYAALSLLWVPAQNNASRQFIYLTFHLLMFLEIIIFSEYARSPLQSISQGWLIAISLTLIVAMWEITTDNHLALSKQQEDLTMRGGFGLIYRQFASVTFGNYNTYVTFICFALPFLFYCSKSPTSGILIRIVSVLGISLSTVCILYNASRGGLLVILIMSFIFIIRSLGRRINPFIIALFAIVAFAVYYRFSSTLFLAIELRTADDMLLDGDSRYKIWLNAWKAFSQTFGLGVGLGGIEPSMLAVSNGITAPHNFFIEILLEFGVLVFIPFILYIFGLARKSFRLSDNNIKTAMYLALIAMPIYAIIDSGCVKNPFAFVAFASFTVFANYEHFLMPNHH